MKVLHLISSGGYYGAENVMVSLAESLADQGCCSTIGVFDHGHDGSEDLIREAGRRGLPVVRIPCRGRWDRQTLRGVRGAIESLSVDVVHSHGYKTDIYSYFAARPLGIPLVATCHNWTHDSAAVRMYEFLDALVLRAFDSVVVVSERMAATMRSSGIAPSKLHLIENGVDVVAFSTASARRPSPSRPCKLVVGTAGRLIPLKGLAYFLQAARELLFEFAEVSFVIVGAGPEREKLQQLARELGIGDSVLFTGHCQNMPVAYASMDIFVLASLLEAMPMVVLEALAAEKPVIATQVGAVPRIISAGETGLLVPPKDVQALKLAMLRLLRDAPLRRRLGEAGAAAVRGSHSRQAMAKKYLHVYQQLKNLVAGRAPLRRAAADATAVGRSKGETA